MPRLVVILIALCAVGEAARAAEVTAPPAPRRPIAVAVVGGGVAVANRAGTVSFIDQVAGRVADEVAVGARLSDLIAVGPALLAIDESGGRAVRLARHDGRWCVDCEARVGASPVALRASADGRVAVVSLLWAHRLAIVDVGAMRVTGTVDLPFAPRALWASPDGRTAVAAEAFGGRLAVVDMAGRRVTATKSIHGHNVRGLAMSRDGREMVVPHAMMEERLATERNNVFWGSVVGDVVRSLDVGELVRPGAPATSAEGLHRWTLYPLGEPNRGAGDPGEVIVTPAGYEVISLGGVDQVAVRGPGDRDFERIAVGRRPAGLACSADGATAYVACTYSDEVAVVDLAAKRVRRTISLGATRELTEAERGEALFHDARLSLDGWYSCQSCHTDGHAAAPLNDNFSDGSFGTPKRILSLLGTADTGPWAWNGSAATLEEQVGKSIRGTMQGKEAGASAENMRAIAAYLRTLAPAPGLAAARGDGDAPRAARGRRIFEEMDCARCHAGAAMTSDKAYDVGASDEAGARRFSPPSLRGVSQRTAWLHDGRAGSLEDVFARHGHPDGAIDARRAGDLVEYLRGL